MAMVVVDIESVRWLSPTSAPCSHHRATATPVALALGGASATATAAVRAKAIAMTMAMAMARTMVGASAVCAVWQVKVYVCGLVLCVPVPSRVGACIHPPVQPFGPVRSDDNACSHRVVSCRIVSYRNNQYHASRA
jgi:hypothetical protein